MQDFDLRRFLAESKLGKIKPFSVRYVEKNYPEDAEEIFQNIKDEGMWEEFEDLYDEEEVEQFLYTYMN